MSSLAYVHYAPAMGFLRILLACALGSSACSAGGDDEVMPPAGITYAADAGVGHSCTGQIYYPDNGGYVACRNGAWVFEGASWSIPSGYTLDDDLEDEILPGGLRIGLPCTGDVYFEYPSGFFVCVKGLWTYEGLTWTVPAGYDSLNGNVYGH